MKKILLITIALIFSVFISHSQCNSITITLHNPDVICYNNNSLLTASIEQSGNEIYSWESSSNENGPWIKISSPLKGYTFVTPPLKSDTYIRCNVQDATRSSPCDNVYSNVIKLTVLPQLISSVIIGDENVCKNSTASPIKIDPNSPGSSGLYMYQWESSSAIDGSFEPIWGATTTTYTPVISGTVYFRLRTTSVDCGSVYSNVVTKSASTDTPPLIFVTDPEIICSGVAYTFKINTTNVLTNPSYQWYMDGVSVGTNEESYTYMANVSDNGKQLTVEVTSLNPCSNNYQVVVSSPVILNTVDSYPSPTVSINSSENTSCQGMPVSFYAIATNNSGSPTYQWYINNTPVGNSATTYVNSALISMDEVWVKITSNLSCVSEDNFAVSNKISCNIKPALTPQIVEESQTICSGEPFAFFATSLGPGTVLQWQFNGVDIPGATNINYTSNEAGVYVVVENNGICSTASIPVTLTVDPCSDFSSSISGPNTVASNQQNIAYSVTNQNGFSYVWSITGGTIISGQNTHAITVDWDGGTSAALARTTVTQQSVSVTETKQSANLSKTTTMEVNNTTTAVALPVAQSGIQFYPNPATDAFNIVMPQSGTSVNYTITDLAGTAVANGTFTSTGGAEKITTDFNAGLYQVVLKYNETVTCLRLNKVQ